MEMTYENILKFMQEYFPVYSDYGQDPATARRMEDYYAPDFVFTGYVGYPEPLIFPNRDSFLAFDVSHPSSYERLTPEDMTIDERRKTVCAIIKFEFIDRKTGEVLVVERGTTQYQLVLDEDGNIKIKSFVFFPQRVVPGVLTGADVFRKDRGKL
jgi:hypothetical protein